MTIGEGCKTSPSFGMGKKELGIITFLFCILSGRSDGNGYRKRNNNDRQVKDAKKDPTEVSDDMKQKWEELVRNVRGEEYANTVVDSCDVVRDV